MCVYIGYIYIYIIYVTYEINSYIYIIYNYREFLNQYFDDSANDTEDFKGFRSPRTLNKLT